MKDLITQILKMMPIWFGICFLGPVLAELYLRTPLMDALAFDATTQRVYLVCMVFGGAYGTVAWRFGRWI